MNYTQLTRDGRWKAGLATDGTWAYFIEQADHGRDLCKVSLHGGEITRIPLGIPYPNTIAVSPDGAKLLIAEASWFNQRSNLWVFTTSGRPLHHVGGGVNSPFAWAPGQRIVYGHGSTIWTSDENGEHETQIENAPESVDRVGWSSDAKRIWYTTEGPAGSPVGVGQVNADGQNHRRLFEAYGSGTGLCCGFWSTSGANFGFLSSSLQRTELLVTPDFWPWFYRSRPVSRAVLGMPAISEFASNPAQNRFLVLAGGPWHEDVFRFDRAKGQFASYLDGVSARDLDFSPDGKSAVYVDGYDGTLWRYDLEKRRKTRMANPPFYALLPRWSPDGKRIALVGSGLEGSWKIYRLPAGGGTPERLIPSDENEGAPTWSPDGNSLIFGKVDCIFSDQCGIYQYNLATHSLRLVPGSQGFRTARWSPNGKYIAALRLADENLMLFDFSSQKWRVIHHRVGGDVLAWSRDSNYVYGYDPFSDEPNIFRVAVPSGTIEPVADLKGLEPPGKDVFPWFGLAPDGSPLISRDSGENEVYSVGYQMP